MRYFPWSKDVLGLLIATQFLSVAFAVFVPKLLLLVCAVPKAASVTQLWWWRRRVVLMLCYLLCSM